MLLDRAFLAHELGLLGGIGLTLDDAIQKPVEQTLQACIDLGDVRALLGENRLRRFFVLRPFAVEAQEHVVRPIGAEGVWGDEAGNVRVEGFLADIGLGALPRLVFLGAAVIDVAFLRLGGDGPAAFGAHQQAGKRLGCDFLARAGIAEAAGEHGAGAVGQFLGDDRLMRALVHVARVAEVSVVYRIGEKVRDEGVGHELAVFGAHAALREKAPHRVERFRAGGVAFIDLAHKQRSLPVHDHPLGAVIVEIAKRREAGKFAAAHFFAQSALHVFGKRVHVVFAEAKFIVEHELALRRVFKPCAGKLEGRKLARIEHVNDASAIHAVSRQPVGMPGHDAGRFSRLDAFQHPIKNRPSRNFRRLLLDAFADDREVFALGKLAHFGKLRLDGKDLLVLVVGGLPGVEQVGAPGVVILAKISGSRHGWHCITNFL